MGTSVVSQQRHESKMMVLYNALAALLLVTAITAETKIPIVSFDDDVITVPSSPKKPVAVEASVKPEADEALMKPEADGASVEPEANKATLKKPEKLAALLSGIYSAVDGHQMTTSELETLSEISKTQIPFDDLNEKQLNVVGNIIGALQTGAINAETSDSDYVRLNLAAIPAKTPPGMYALADPLVEQPVPSAGRYPTSPYSGSQKYYAGSYPAADYYSSGYPSYMRYPVSHRYSPMSQFYSGYYSGPNYGSYGSASVFSGNPFRNPYYPSYQGYGSSGYSAYGSPFGFPSYRTSGNGFRRPASSAASPIVVRVPATNEHFVIDQRSGIVKKLETRPSAPSASSAPTKTIVRTQSGEVFVLDQETGSAFKVNVAPKPSPLAQESTKNKIIVKAADGNIFLVDEKTGQVTLMSKPTPESPVPSSE